MPWSTFAYPYLLGFLSPLIHTKSEQPVTKQPDRKRDDGRKQQPSNDSHIFHIPPWLKRRFTWNPAKQHCQVPFINVHNFINALFSCPHHLRRCKRHWGRHGSVPQRKNQGWVHCPSSKFEPKHNLAKSGKIASNRRRQGWRYTRSRRKTSAPAVSSVR